MLETNNYRYVSTQKAFQSDNATAIWNHPSFILHSAACHSFISQNTALPYYKYQTLLMMNYTKQIVAILLFWSVHLSYNQNSNRCYCGLISIQLQLTKSLDITCSISHYKITAINLTLCKYIMKRDVFFLLFLKTFRTSPNIVKYRKKMVDFFQTQRR